MDALTVYLLKFSNCHIFTVFTGKQKNWPEQLQKNPLLLSNDEIRIFEARGARNAAATRAGPLLRKGLHYY